MKSLVSDLNQNREAVQRIAEAVNVHNERLRQQDEEKAKQEKAELEALRKKRKEEAEAAQKDQGKGKIEESPIPSPQPMEFPEIAFDARELEDELKLRQQHEEESRQEELDTLNALLEHYKREANEAKANRHEYEVKWLEASKKLTEQEELITKLTHEGVEALPEQQTENLKEAIRHIRQENKDMSDKYQ